MLVEINHLSCGEPGSIIDCYQHASFQCAFCKECGSWFSEIKEVTPAELVELIKKYRYIIKMSKPSKFK